jgi:hypothetical protein
MGIIGLESETENNLTFELEWQLHQPYEGVLYIELYLMIFYVLL